MPLCWLWHPAHYLGCHLPLHPLHSAAPDAHHRRHPEDAIPGHQMRPDGVLDLGRQRGATEPLALLKIDSAAPVAVG